MKPEYFCIIILFLIIVGLLIFIRNETKRSKQESARQKDQHEQELSIQQAEATKYKDQVDANIRKNIPYGERLLIKAFRNLFVDCILADATIYNHLEWETNNGFKQVDYFIVSPKGLFVVESKRWKGITYIYSNSFPDMFQKTVYRSFGVGSSEKIRVFNAQQDVDNEGKIQLSAYQNPIGQAREYSKHLIDILNVRQVKNIVVFSLGEGYEVLYNNEPLSITAIDSYTSLITDVSLKDFFVSLPSENIIDVQSIIEFVDKNLHYRFKLDNSNYQQAPFIPI